MAVRQQACYDLGMTLPNLLTISRFILACIGCVFLLLPIPYHYTVAGALFVVAALTDYFDGYIARQYQSFSQLGTFMDPLADKLLVFLYFTHFTLIGMYPEWLFLVVLARDLFVDGLRSYAASRQIIGGANSWSKWKTAFQMTSLVLGIAALGLLEFDIDPQTLRWMPATIVWTMLAAFIFGLIGAVAYLRHYNFVLTRGE